MGIEQIPNTPIEPTKEKDGYILENGIWKKRTKEEDAELTDQDKESDDTTGKETNERLRLLEEKLKELDNKEYINPDDIKKKEKLEKEYAELDKQTKEARKEEDGKEKKEKINKKESFYLDWVLENGIWRKRTKEEDAELTEQDKEQIKKDKEQLEKMGVSPEMEKILQDPEALSKFFHEAFEVSKNPEVQEKFQELKNIIEKIIKGKDKEEAPESVAKAAEFIKGEKKDEKKESPWETVFGAAGQGILLFLVLFILAELKGVEVLSGQATGKKKEKK